MFERLKTWAASIKREALVLWFASRDPRAPRLAKWLAIFIVAYALSPIDLIPDFIPVVGYLDELLLLPGAIWLVLKLMPAEVLMDSRAKATDWLAKRRTQPRNWIAAAVIVALWITGLWALGAWWLQVRR
jgi:uncharacterized membrane protein YkvA (DUF1232 family)